MPLQSLVSPAPIVRRDSILHVDILGEMVLKETVLVSFRNISNKLQVLRRNYMFFFALLRIQDFRCIQYYFTFRMESL